MTVSLLGPLVCVAAGLGYLYVTSAGLVEERMRDASTRTGPRVFARPLRLHRGQLLSRDQLVARLDDLGYAHRRSVTSGGEFAAARTVVVLRPRAGAHAGRPVRIAFDEAVEPHLERVAAIEDGERSLEALELDRPLISGLANAGRQKRRHVRLGRIPRGMIEAVVAIEDRRFYLHPGVDPIRMVAAAITNVMGTRPYLVGGSTITQQLVKNFFLSPEKTIRRKLTEQVIALILEQRLTKDEILELYLNEVYLGQRGSFAIHGVPEAARLFFGKSVANVTLAEAATIAGVIQSPAALSPFRAPRRARARRNVVLDAMHEAGFITADTAMRVAREPLRVASRPLDAEAPHFVDHVADRLDALHPGIARTSWPVEIETTLDFNLQQEAQAAVAEGLAAVDRASGAAGAEAALVALDPRTGAVVAMVGGRSYGRSQFNRVTRARRQPGSVFKPFVYLAAFERAAAEGWHDLTPLTVVRDEPTSFVHDRRVWRPSNYRDVYEGPITLRRALAMSRNVAAVKVAERTGYDHVAGLWGAIGGRPPPDAFPSIALGVLEATPLEIATAYTLFANQGVLREARPIERVTLGGVPLAMPDPPAPRRVARPETSFLVGDMMRSVLSSGTGAAASRLGFRRSAAGKSGTTNDLRDAWFVGFTPSLLTVVWVGRDDNSSLGLSGTEAALPIWSRFMHRALEGRPVEAFAAPDDIVVATVDRATGELAGPRCPHRDREAFVRGTEPTRRCRMHP